MTFSWFVVGLRRTISVNPPATCSCNVSLSWMDSLIAVPRVEKEPFSFTCFKLSMLGVSNVNTTLCASAIRNQRIPQPDMMYG